LGRPNPRSNYGWDRSFHFDGPDRFGNPAHFNAEIGPLRGLNHRRIPSSAYRAGSTTALRTIGRSAVGIGLAFDVYDIITACDRSRAVGGALGGWGGALGGAAVGSALVPGVGTVIGGLLGGFFGSAAGQIAGS
jgi:hypothetical protein